jgi:hypothetical protein
MKKLFILSAAMILIAVMSSVAMAATTGTQTVTYTMPGITNISINDGTVNLVLVDPDDPTKDPTPVSNDDTSYNIWTNKACHITGQLSPAMNTGLTLTIEMTAPTGGTSTAVGFTSTTSGAQSLITGIPKGTKEAAKTIKYTLSATVDAEPTTTGSTTVTFTIVSP